MVSLSGIRPGSLYSEPKLSLGGPRLQGASPLFPAVGFNAYDNAPWKTPEQLAAENSASRLETEKSAYGEVIPILRGAIIVQCRTIWRSSVTTVTKRTSGGKGGGSSTKTSKKKQLHIALLVADNPFGRSMRWLRLFADGVAILDQTSGTPVFKKQVTGFAWYDGTQTTADPTIISFEGEENTPAFVNSAYMVVSIDPKDYGDRVPIFTMELADSASLSSGNELLEFLPALTADDNIRVNDGHVFDFAGDFIYQLILTGSQYHLSTISLLIEQEIRRVPVSGSPSNLYFPVPVPGQPLILLTAEFGSSSETYNALISAESGAILGSIRNQEDGSGGGDNRVLWFNVVQYGENEYLAIGMLDEVISGPNQITGTGLALLAFNVDGSGMRYVTYGDLGPEEPIDLVDYLCVGEVGNGYVQFFWINEDTLYEGTAFGDLASWREVFAPGVQIEGAVYDDTDGTVVVAIEESGVEKLVKIDPATGSRSEEFDITSTVGDVWRIALNQNDGDFVAVETIPGYIAVYSFTKDKYFLIDTFTGVATDISVSKTTYRSTSISQPLGTWYDFDTSGNSWERHGLDQWVPGWVNLVDILTDFSILAGADSDRIEFDPATLGGLQVRGFVIRDDVRWREVIANICSLYGISWTESGGGWKFSLTPVDEDFTPDVTLEAEDLVEQVGDIVSTIRATRLHELDIPYELDVRYIDYADQEYTVSVQTARRPTGVFEVTASKRRETIDVPLIITASQAQRRAREALFRYVAAQSRISFAVGHEFTRIEPGDVVAVPDGDFIRNAKITKATYRSDYSQALEGHDFIEEVETATEEEGLGEGAAEGAGPSSGQEITFPDAPVPALPHSQYIHLDIPLLRYPDDLGGTGLVNYHVLTGIGQSNWPGADLYRSPDGFDYQVVATKDDNYPVVGVAVTLLGEPSANFTTDNDNTVRIQVTAGDATEIESCTYAQLYNGYNAAAIGAPGRWEIIQFKTVTSIGANLVDLSNLVRGRRGTEVYQGTHQIGDRFVLLHSDYVSKLNYATGDLDADFFFKAVGFDQEIADIASQERVISGAAETCYAPVHLNAEYVGDDIEFSLVPRTRFDGRWQADGSSVPIGEVESYEFDIMDGDTVVRTLASSSRTVTYDQTQITSDWGTPPGIITFRAYQLNAITGRGHQASVTKLI